MRSCKIYVRICQSEWIHSDGSKKCHVNVATVTRCQYSEWFPVSAFLIYSERDNSPIRTVIVFSGDVSDFHHIQGVVGDLICRPNQDVSVFPLTTPWKSPAELPTVFWQTPRSCGNLIAVRIHISEFTRRNRFKISVLIPFWALPNTVMLVLRCNLHINFWNAGKYLKETILHDCSTTGTGEQKKKKSTNFQNGSLLWQQQVCNTILKCVLYKQIYIAYNYIQTIARSIFLF